MKNNDYLPMYKKLVIVSDTAMYFHNGAWFGFSPVVAEIEYIAPKFQEIIWIGYNRMDLLSNQTMQAIQSKHIKCVTFEKLEAKAFCYFKNSCTLSCYVLDNWQTSLEG